MTTAPSDITSNQVTASAPPPSNASPQRRVRGQLPAADLHLHRPEHGSGRHGRELALGLRRRRHVHPAEPVAHLRLRGPVHGEPPGHRQRRRDRHQVAPGEPHRPGCRPTIHRGPSSRSPARTSAAPSWTGAPTTMAPWRAGRGTFGDGSTSSERNPSHTYAAEGRYDVLLMVTDDDGAADTKTHPADPTAPRPRRTSRLTRTSTSTATTSSAPSGTRARTMTGPS